MVGLNLIFLALTYEGLLSSPHKVLFHFLIAGYKIKKPTIPNITLLKLKLSERPLTHEWAHRLDLPKHLTGTLELTVE